MTIFTDQGLDLLVRWLHIGAGITWIGLLYYFNFVQGPSVAQFEPSARTELTRKLAPRALAWFRYAALVTWLAGVLLLLTTYGGDIFTYLGSPAGLTIASGMTLGTIMFLNVWGVIWRNQKVIIASAEAAATGGQADPRVPALTRRALLASRTNVVMSIPMLFFMASSAHLSLFGSADSGKRWTYALIALVLTLLVEANALFGDQGAATKLLDKVGSTIWTGVIFWVVLYAVIEVVTS